jgi:hypothetical protein
VVPLALNPQMAGMAGIAGVGLLGLLGAGFLLMNRKGLLLRRRIGIPIAPTGVTTGVTTSAASGILRQATGTPIYSSGVPMGVTTGVATATGAPIVHSRKIPLKERALAKVSGRPVITNYH